MSNKEEYVERFSAFRPVTRFFIYKEQIKRATENIEKGVIVATRYASPDRERNILLQKQGISWYAVTP